MLVLQMWQYLIDHLPSIIGAVFAGYVVMRSASKKDIEAVKNDAEAKHQEAMEVGSVNAVNIEEIRTATNGLTKALVVSTAKASLAEGVAKGRADQKAEDK